MKLELDDDQRLLRDSLARFLTQQLPFEKRRAMRDAGAQLALWRTADAAIGIGAAALPGDVGGFGGGRVAAMIVAEELGAALAVTPYIDCHVLTAGLLLALDETARAAAIARGEALIVTAIEEAATRGDIGAIAARAARADDGWTLTGRKIAVGFAAEADHIVVPARDGEDDLRLFLVPAASLAGRLQPYWTIDDMPAADIDLDGLWIDGAAEIGCGSDGEAALQAAIDAAIAALSAEAAGLARVLLDDTLLYAKQRRQFGATLSSFQALQHRMVDMLMLREAISAAAMLAALKPGDAQATAAAKATIGDALRTIGQEAVQLHGAMGMTEELRVGHYFKRATAIGQRLGTSDFHVARYAAAMAS
ncbi:pimeloyl-CoA dehydrogenase small subunit [Sphingopyxis sp. YF1]|uniref:acyl-CoA dehydrogenase family protein n=1 Tax=Sphingopyxis sp. YF1 TaxID=2482763 RepID=UPI001F6192F8|nr:acyl-CoA dehydrogenase family protein [Sphingopyxis sp. YF1]UNU44196.1 pimeloyl-CoA dehydrogenase small subunit [Sphingopyxis sp. YF1]